MFAIQGDLAKTDAQAIRLKNTLKEIKLLGIGGAILGGLGQSSNTQTKSGVAGLMQIPFLGSVLGKTSIDNSDNARSLSILFSFGKFQFLDCGDLTWNVEKKLVCPTDLIGQIDVFQVTHHGMDISNHPTLLKTIAPTVAVMNNSPTKGGSAATVKLLKSLPSLKALYALHKNAATSPDDNADPALTANSDPAGVNYIKVSVAPDGSTFTVQIEGGGPAKRLESK